MQWSTEEILSQAHRRITLGQGGADVYELTGGRIAKHIRRDRTERTEAWAQYVREAQFYAGHRAQGLPFVPEILHCSLSEDEILIVMRKYEPLQRAALDDGLLARIVKVLAQIHALPVEMTPAQMKVFGDDEIAQCLSGWRGVLAEHGDAFDVRKLEEIASAINDINRRHFSPRQCLCHGDFHFENLLADDAGNIVVCDWQNVCCSHPASDIAFLLSRLEADGCSVDRDRVIGLYCECSAEEIMPEEIDAQMRLSALNTAFAFWHYFLHGATAETVRGIYEKMAADAHALQNE